MASGNCNTPEDYRELVTEFIENGGNMSQALTACDMNPTNGSRIKKNSAFQEALAMVRSELIEETGCTKEKVLEMIMSTYNEINRRNMTGCATDAARLAEVKLKCIDKLIKICGFEAPTQHITSKVTGQIDEYKDALNELGASKPSRIKEVSVKQE